MHVWHDEMINPLRRLLTIVCVRVLAFGFQLQRSVGRSFQKQKFRYENLKYLKHFKFIFGAVRKMSPSILRQREGNKLNLNPYRVEGFRPFWRIGMAMLIFDVSWP